MIVKAGVLPYYIDEEQNVYVQLMVPSNAKYGGKSPQLAKGHVEENCDIEVEAFREGTEELGLIFDNILQYQKIGEFYFDYKKDYFLHVYMVEIIDKNNYIEHSTETKSAEFYLIEEAEKKIRKDQRRIIQQFKEILQWL